jgi:pimeloyl-ACP methyl ester carboxylesterase
MKTILHCVFFVALAVVGAACASNSGDSTATGGASGSGATSSAGGSTSSGGSGSADSTATGGASGSGATSSAGGSTSGGGAGTGGAAGSGGAPESGGAHSGGSIATGGASGSGGASSTGGSTSSGGSGGDAAGSGGAPESGGAQGGDVIRARTIETRGFTFDALETVSDGEPVLLLHGFPDTSLMWTRLMTVLSENGYHCLAPDQRGYSPGARPTEVEAYRYEELIADAFAFGSVLGDRYHVVAHDWGANVGWLMLATDPSPIASFTPISIPHYGVWARSVYDDPEMSGYLGMLDTWMTPGDGEAFWTEQSMRNMWKAKPADLTEATIAHMMEPGAMTAALNWYRASDGHKSVIEDYDLWEVSVPTLLIHGSTDLGERSVTDTEPLMKGPYRVVRPEGGHFIVDEQPEVVAEETLAHLQAYRIK